jgi:dTDP-4-amino-4,6-dideoxygalactose transaminase
MALGIGPGDEVITTPYTFFATVGAIVRIGAVPVFVDIDPVTFNIDPAGIAAKITPRTKAIIPVHLFGQCADMDPILAIAQQHHLAVIEDAAQAIGAEYKGRRAGSMGTAGCFSFFPSKNLGCCGDGGAVVANDPALADKIRLLRGHGSHPKYYHKIVGGNFRLDTIHAAVLRVKLPYLDGWTAARQQGAAYYTASLAKHGLTGSVVHVPRTVQSRHIFNQYVVRLEDRDSVRDHLKKERITTEVYYPCPMHLQECFAYLGHGPGDFPESELAAQTTVALPMYPEMSHAQRERVVRGMAAYYEATGRLSRRLAA